MSDGGDTEPMRLRVGDRVALENRIEIIDAKYEARAAEQKERADTFYQTRMIPLESAQRSSNMRSAISLTLSVVAILVVLLLLGLVVVLHY